MFRVKFAAIMAQFFAACLNFIDERLFVGASDGDPQHQLQEPGEGRKNKTTLFNVKEKIGSERSIMELEEQEEEN